MDSKDQAERLLGPESLLPLIISFNYILLKPNLKWIYISKYHFSLSYGLSRSQLGISPSAIAVDQIVRNTQLQISTSVKKQEMLQGNFYKFLQKENIFSKRMTILLVLRIMSFPMKDNVSSKFQDASLYFLSRY